jgi:iron complex transport system substrate-binding protein
LLLLAVMALLQAGCRGERTEPEVSRNAGGIRDALGREWAATGRAERVICSGSDCLRLLTYLQAQDRIVAVDSIERRGSPLDARPYAITNPQFKTYPLFGEFRGWDNPELIAGLNPQPQLIFKMLAARGPPPEALQRKTDIPVIPLHAGDLQRNRETLDRSLRTMGAIMGEARRAEEVIAFFDTLRADLEKRTRGLGAEQRPLCYIGGVGQRGPHGLQSTDPCFAPFAFLRARNAAAPDGNGAREHATISKEQLIVWDPDAIFVDISTLRLAGEANAVAQLRDDPAYRILTAVRTGRVYGVFPHNSYGRNFETVFANAYYIGAVLYPERFADIDPMRKAEAIAEFLNGGPAFDMLNREFGGLGFTRIPME